MAGPQVDIAIAPSGVVTVTTTEKGLPGFQPLQTMAQGTSGAGKYVKVYNVADAQQFAWDLISDKVVGWTSDQAVAYFNQQTNNGKNFNPSPEVLQNAQADAAARRQAATPPTPAQLGAVPPPSSAPTPPPTASADTSGASAPMSGPPPGTTTTGPIQTTVTPQGQVNQTTLASYIDAHPDIAWAQQIGDLKSLLDQAVAQNWDETKWTEELQASAFGKAHTSAQLQWIQEYGSRPVDAARDIAEKAAEVQAKARSLGINLSQTDINALAVTSLYNGWSDQDFNNHWAQMVNVQNGQPSLARAVMDPATGKLRDTFTGREAYYGPQNAPATPDINAARKAWGNNFAAYTQEDGTIVYYQTMGPSQGTGTISSNTAAAGTSNMAAGVGPGAPAGVGATTAGGVNPVAAAPGSGMLPGGGALGGLLDTFKALAAQYLVPVSDPTLQQFASQAVASGDLSNSSAFEAYLKQQAENLWGPQVAALINQGQTTRQILDPYLSQASSLLGIDPSGIDPTDPKWAKALANPDGKGNLSMMTLPQWQQTLMSDPVYGYQHSLNAANRAASFANYLGTMFGQTTGGSLSGVAPAGVTGA